MARTGLNDGLGEEEVITWSGTNLQTQNAFFTGSVTSAAAFSGLNAFIAGSVQADKVIADVQATGLNIYATGSILAGGRRLNSNGAGSPTTWGKIVQGGTGTLGGGSDVWVTFGTGFSTTPDSFVAIGAATSPNSIACIAGSLNAGSAYVQGEVASEDFYWVAIGTK